MPISKPVKWVSGTIIALNVISLISFESLAELGIIDRHNRDNFYIVALGLISCAILFPIIFLGFINALKFGNMTPSRAIMLASFTYLVTIFYYGCIFTMLSEFDSSYFNVKIDVEASMYFSVTTMATVGFGDIYAIKGLPRTVVCMEILTGVFFNIVLFAMLTAYLADRMITRSKLD